ncbi:MAG: tyrosine-type recombinase/integrase, partial [Patescibacteria group bacterium]
MIPFETAHQKFTEFLKKRGRASATMLAYSKDISQLLDFSSKKGKSLVHEIAKEDIDDFLNDLKSANYTAKSISRKINSTRTFFKFLVDEKVIKFDPARLVEHPKFTPKAPRILSKLEYRALRDTVKNDPRTAAILEVFLQTGIRISELANLKMTDVVIQNEGMGKMLVLKREIPLNRPVQEALKSYLAIKPKTKSKSFFVTKSGKPLLVRNIRATIDRYFKKTGIEHATVNDFRHTFIVQHLKEGASLLYISKI